MVGIGGSGMSGIAEVLVNLGYTVSGSDLSDSPAVMHLRSLGVVIARGHHASNVGDVHVIVISTAIAPDNPEIAEARKRHIPVIPRAEMLAELMRLRKGVAIAGTHGKTTTTSLTAAIFDQAGLDPTVIIGGRLNVYGANAHLGKGEYLIAEADESDSSFLCLLPIINVVTNVDEDHLDHYCTREALDEAFVRFMNHVPFYGMNIVCGDDPGARRLLGAVKRPVTTYGFDDKNDICARNCTSSNWSSFEVFLKGERLGKVRLPQPGRHNVLNALAAIGVGLQAQVSFANCVEGLGAFQGVGRRFELKGEKNGITVIDDYGHHPVEIAATLRTAREVFPGRRIVAAFQPHRFTRTKDHFDEFCKVLALADMVLLTEIYAASEKPIPGISGRALACGLQKEAGLPVYFYNDIEAMVHGMTEHLRCGDVLLTLGAGSITRTGPAWLKEGRHA